MRWHLGEIASIREYGACPRVADCELCVERIEQRARVDEVVRMRARSERDGDDWDAGNECRLELDEAPRPFENMS